MCIQCLSPCARTAQETPSKPAPDAAGAKRQTYGAGTGAGGGESSLSNNMESMSLNSSGGWQESFAESLVMHLASGELASSYTYVHMCMRGRHGRGSIMVCVLPKP